MITPIIERLVMSGEARIITQTLGMNGAFTIDVPKGKTIIITSVNVQPCLGLTRTTYSNFPSAQFASWEDYVESALQQSFDDNGAPIQNNRLGVLELLLKRGLMQIELYSQDNNSVLTYSNEYVPVPIPNIPANEKANIIWLPQVTERHSDIYSVHKNTVHLRLRFNNSMVMDDGQIAFQGGLNTYRNAVNNNELENLVPESNNSVFSLNQPNIWINTSVYYAYAGVLGIIPFSYETNYDNVFSGGTSVEQFVRLPYTSNVETTDANGANGELGYFNQNQNLTSVFYSYAPLFTPYINITYALINEQPNGNTIVSPEKYQNVIIAK